MRQEGVEPSVFLLLRQVRMPVPPLPPVTIVRSSCPRQDRTCNSVALDHDSLPDWSTGALFRCIGAGGVEPPSLGYQPNPPPLRYAPSRPPRRIYGSSAWIRTRNGWVTASHDAISTRRN